MGIGIPFAQPPTQSGELLQGTRPFTLDRLFDMYDEGGFDRHFVRHDVDYSIEAALQMARWEENLGYRSTYYLMDGNPFYSKEDAVFCFHELVLMGHDVGLHADERLLPEKWDAGFDYLAGLKVSFHCPTANVLWRDFPGFFNAYESFWKDKYTADSNGVFRYGDPEDEFWFGDVNTRWQINLHPEWWFEPGWHRRVSDEDWAEFFHGAPRPLAWIPSQYP